MVGLLLLQRETLARPLPRQMRSAGPATGLPQRLLLLPEQQLRAVPVEPELVSESVDPSSLLHARTGVVAMLIGLLVPTETGCSESQRSEVDHA